MVAADPELPDVAPDPLPEEPEDPLADDPEDPPPLERPAPEEDPPGFELEPPPPLEGEEAAEGGDPLGELFEPTSQPIAVDNARKRSPRQKLGSD